MSDNLIKNLREKTEEADLDTILKTTLGGYTRKSVREYLSMLRQQQYDLQQSFAEELQLVQTERERLALELEEAGARAAAAEEALAQAGPLIDKASGLEKDMDEAIARIQSDAVLLEEQQQALQQVQQECDALRAELSVLKMESENDIRPCDVQPAAETAPSESPDSVQLQLAMLTREQQDAEKRMELIIRQEKRLFEALEACRTELEERRDQNLCLQAENKVLSERLAEQMLQNISLDREVTYMRTMNDNLKAKLDAALPGEAHADQTAGDLLIWDPEK